LKSALNGGLSFRTAFGSHYGVNIKECLYFLACFTSARREKHDCEITLLPVSECPPISTLWLLAFVRFVDNFIWTYRWIPRKNRTASADKFWDTTRSGLRLKRDGTRAETRFRLSTKRTSPFKSRGASVQSTAGSRGVCISGNNNNNNNNYYYYYYYYLLQLGFYPVAVVILHLYKIWNWLLLNLMLDTPCSEEVWRVLPTPFASFPFTSPPVRHRVPSHFNCSLRHDNFTSQSFLLMTHCHYWNLTFCDACSVGNVIRQTKKETCLLIDVTVL